MSNGFDNHNQYSGNFPNNNPFENNQQYQHAYPNNNPSNPQKDWTTAILLSAFLGSLGIDRFYMGYTALGILKLVTLGGCSVWWLIDLILIAMNSLPDADGRPLAKK